MSNQVHSMQQGKGGVGKSFSMTLLAQYLVRTGEDLFCADTDPVNATLSQYSALDVSHINITQHGQVLQRNFDPLMEAILATEANVVIDNGAATFLPLVKYMEDNEIYRIMSEAGKRVYVHTILTGGQAKSDTFNGFAELVKRVDGNARIVVWENEFWGPVEFDGHSIVDSKLYQDAFRAGKIAGIVKIADHSHSDANIADIKQMTEAHLTLDEVMSSPDFSFLKKNRLRKIVHGIFDELDRIDW